MVFQLPHHIQFVSMITDTDDESDQTALELGYECPGKSTNLLLSHDTPPGFDKSPHTVEVDIFIDIMTLEHSQTMLPDQRMPSFDWMQWREIQDFVGKLCLSTLLELASSSNESRTTDESGSRTLYDHLIQRPSTCK
jgi:hypothetical protein